MLRPEDLKKGLDEQAQEEQRYNQGTVFMVLVIVALAVVVILIFREPRKDESVGSSETTMSVGDSLNNPVTEESLMDSINKEIEARIMESLPDTQELDYGQMHVDDKEYEIVDS